MLRNRVGSQNNTIPETTVKPVITRDRQDPRRTSTMAVATGKAGPADSVISAQPRHPAAMASLRQLVGALFAEGLLQREPSAPPSAFPARRSYRLGDSQWMLEVFGGQENLGVFQRFERITVVSPGCTQRTLHHPRELLSVLVEAEVISSAAAGRLGDEISESIVNDAACRRFRTKRDARIRAALLRRDQSFWEWLTAGGAGGNPALFLEQWSSVGHPYHVMKKAKQGLRLEEVMANAPEFTARVPMTLLAVRRERLHLESAAGQDNYLDYMACHFPAWIDQWSAALRDQHLSAGDFVPVPAHPLQVEQVLPRLGVDPDQGDIRVLRNLQLNARPTSSFRTLVPLASACLPHLKLAVGLRLTTVPRTISPRSCEMGPRINILLRDILAHNPDISARLSIAPELYGMHFVAPGGGGMEWESNVAAIVRDNPVRQAGPDEWLVPATAFSVPEPGSGKPFLVDILASTGDDSLAAARTFFQHYAETLLTGLLTLYLKYGIALEAHQQNIFAVLRSDGQVIRFVARDFGGIRIHRPSLEAHGHHLELHADRLTVREDWAAVRKKLLTPVYHYHLGEIAATLGGYYGCGDRPFWHVLADLTDGIFAALREQMEPTRWHAEREAILNADWELKATLRMRLAGAGGDCYTAYANPLKVRH